MSAPIASRTALRLIARRAQPIKPFSSSTNRYMSSQATGPMLLSPSSRRRIAASQSLSSSLGLARARGGGGGAAVPRGARSIFIQTEETPNVDALKFRPNHRVLPDGVSAPYLEYLSPRDTISPPYPSPLAARLMDIDGVIAVFYGTDFITVTKRPDTQWAHVRPEVFALITETVTAGAPIVTLAVAGGGEATGEGAAGPGQEVDSLAENPDDDPVVGMIKELLATRIRPAIQEDGGDIDYRGFEDGFVLLKLRGACRTCSSGEDTLKQGIESMLMHYIEEVKGVRQMQNPEDEISAREFAKFEEKLQAQKTPATWPPTSKA